MAAFLPAIGSLASSLLGGIFGNQKQTSTINQTQTQNQNQTGASTGQNTPVYDPITETVRNTLLNYMQQQLFSDPNMSGYTSQGLAANNAASAARTRNLNFILSARGLNTSPVATGALINEQGQRASANAGLLQQVPLLAEQIRQQKLNQFNSFFSSLPVGQKQDTSSASSGYSSGNVSGTSTGPYNPANPLAGGFSSLGTALAGLYGAGAFGGKSYNPGNSGTGLTNPSYWNTNPYGG